MIFFFRSLFSAAIALFEYKIICFIYWNSVEKCAACYGFVSVRTVPTMPTSVDSTVIRMPRRKNELLTKCNATMNKIGIGVQLRACSGGLNKTVTKSQIKSTKTRKKKCFWRNLRYVCFWYIVVAAAAVVTAINCCYRWDVDSSVSQMRHNLQVVHTQKERKRKKGTLYVS